jgi:dTDP-4-amino-4,6-dideoxygalactose transaminase
MTKHDSRLTYSDSRETPSGRSSFLPFSLPSFGREEIDEVVDSISSGWVTSGPKVLRFEEMFCERLGVSHAVAVNSCTAGLHLAVAALNLEPGDEVIVPAITWPATANVVELCGGRVVFADVDPGTLCLDPADCARRITSRTRAIVPVHFAGQPVDLDAFIDLANVYDLALIEDSAHALGTRYKNTEVGANGNVTIFSFHPIKNISTGEGGMIVCEDEAKAEMFRLLRFHGVDRDAWKRYGGTAPSGYDVVQPGWKYNMLDLQAALGIHQLRKLDRFNEQRRELAECYDRLLVDVPEIRPLDRVTYSCQHAWHLYIVRLNTDVLTLDRDGFMAELARENIGTGLHFPPVHLLTYYREKYKISPGSLPHAEGAGERILSLPLYPRLTPEDQSDVVLAVQKVLAAHRR